MRSCCGSAATASRHGLPNLWTRLNRHLKKAVAVVSYIFITADQPTKTDFLFSRLVSGSTLACNENQLQSFSICNPSHWAFYWLYVFNKSYSVLMWPEADLRPVVRWLQQTLMFAFCWRPSLKRDDRLTHMRSENAQPAPATPSTSAIYLLYQGQTPDSQFVRLLDVSGYHGQRGDNELIFPGR